MIFPIQLQKDIEQERLTMLIRFYFPHFKEIFDEYINECTEVTRLKVSQKDYTTKVLIDLPKKLHPLNCLIVEESKKL